MSGETPSLRGKTVVVFTRNRPLTVPAILSDCILETRAGRMFLVGTGVPAQRSIQEWTDGVRRAIAWDAVDEYLLFTSPEEYYVRQMPMAAPDVGMQPLTPMFELPSGTEGHPVEPSGIAIELETPLFEGSIVLSFSQGRWWRAEVVELQGEEDVLIHFPGWDSKWDVVVPRSELQVYLGESLESDDPFA